MDISTHIQTFKSLRHRSIFVIYGSHSLQATSNLIKICKFQTVHYLYSKNPKLKPDGFVIKKTTYQKLNNYLGSNNECVIIDDFYEMRANEYLKVVETVNGGGLIIILVSECKSEDELRNLEMTWYENYCNSNKFFVGRFFDILKKMCGECVFFVENGILKGMENEIKMEMVCDQNNLEKNNGNCETRKLNGENDCVFKGNNEENDKIDDILNNEEIIDLNNKMNNCRLDAYEEENLNTKLDVINEKPFVGYKSDLNSVAKIEDFYQNLHLTNDQKDGFKKIESLITEKRFKILIESDRGRGKTTLLIKTILKIDKGEKIYLVCDKTSEICQILRFYKNITVCDLKKLKTINKNGFYVVDEASSIKLSKLKPILKCKKVLMASTVCGYEGSGKIFKSNFIKKHNFVKIFMDEPVRYAKDDPIEILNKRIFLYSTNVPKITKVLNYDELELFLINQEKLHKSDELEEIYALFSAGHYRNNPNDLEFILDNKDSYLFVVKNKEGNILCGVQVVIERIVGSKKNGNLILWTMSEFLCDSEFKNKTGVRILRIVVHPRFRRCGLGSFAINQIKKIFRIVKVENERMVSLKINENVEMSNNVFIPIKNVKELAVDYIGVSFALKHKVFMFWLKNGFKMAYLRNFLSDQTGSKSAIMLLGKDMDFENVFLSVFYDSLRFSFKKLQPYTVLQILHGYKIKSVEFNEHEKKLINMNFKCISDVLHLFPKLAMNYCFCDNVNFSVIEKSVLVIIGLQGRNVESLRKILGIGGKEVDSILRSIFYKVRGVLNKEQ